jgi:hypothetical protein
MVTLHDFKTEAAEYGLATDLHRNYLHVIDACHRVLIIDAEPDNQFGVGVYRNTVDWDGGAPPVDGGYLHGDNVRVLFAHALQIAARVSTVATCADCERGYGPGAVCRCKGR